MRRLAVAVIVMALPAGPFAQSAQERPTQADGIVRLLSDLETALTSGKIDGFRAAAAPALPDDDLASLQRAVVTGQSAGAILRERARRPTSSGFEIVADLLVSRGREGRIATWRLLVQPHRGTANRFELTGLTELASVDGLVRLELDQTRQFQIHNLTLTAPDFVLRMASGSAFVAESDNGITALVLRGRGDVEFTPADPAEQGQLRLFNRRPSFISPIDAAFVRVNPSEFDARSFEQSLLPGKVDPVERQRANEIFADLSPRTYNLDLRMLTPERWSLEPMFGSMLVELRSRTHGWLTYARSPGEPEDITFFERSRGRNISVYASAAKLAQRGRFFDEDDDEAYDVVHYDLDVTFDPARLWISGRASLRVRIKSPSAGSLSFRLAQALTVQAVASPSIGELLSLRVVGQNSVLVSLPQALDRGRELTFDFVYSGRLDPQGLDREAIAPQAQQTPTTPPVESPILLPEPRFLYSNRVFWHPQGGVTDYATATLRLTVPSEYQIVASGRLVSSAVSAADGSRANLKSLRTVEYVADRPARYFGCVISRFVPIGTAKAAVPAVAPAERLAGVAGAPAETASVVNLEVVSTPRMIGKNRQTLSRLSNIMSFFSTTIGEAPYSNFTLAALDDNLPGGHSPAFFAVIHQPLPTTPFSWSDDPVSFDSIYPNFFLAHEVAHQWWGQAVGWKNYHEQWLSEGLAQYFAALYADKDRGGDTLELLLGNMRDTAYDQRGQGPISLGYRLGHLQADGRIFRSIVYNKSAVVLHMLRRLIGDDAFFGGLRAFYRDWRFRKAGTDDLRAVFEASSKMKLDRFFERWILGASVPRLRLSAQAEPNGEIGHIRVEQIGEVFDLPLTVAVQYTDGRSDELTLKITGPVHDERIPLKGVLRRVVARDETALYEIVK
jgi:peptidase M1-like protein